MHKFLCCGRFPTGAATEEAGVHRAAGSSTRIALHAPANSVINTAVPEKAGDAGPIRQVPADGQSAAHQVAVALLSGRAPSRSNRGFSRPVQPNSLGPVSGARAQPDATALAGDTLPPHLPPQRLASCAAAGALPDGYGPEGSSHHTSVGGVFQEVKPLHDTLLGGGHASRFAVSATNTSVLPGLPVPGGSVGSGSSMSFARSINRLNQYTGTGSRRASMLDPELARASLQAAFHSNTTLRGLLYTQPGYCQGTAGSLTTVDPWLLHQALRTPVTHSTTSHGVLVSQPHFPMASSGAPATGSALGSAGGHPYAASAASRGGPGPLNLDRDPSRSSQQGPGGLPLATACGSAWALHGHHALASQPVPLFSRDAMERSAALPAPVVLLALQPSIAASADDATEGAAAAGHGQPERLGSGEAAFGRVAALSVDLPPAIVRQPVHGSATGPGPSSATRLLGDAEDLRLAHAQMAASLLALASGEVSLVRAWHNNAAAALATAASVVAGGGKGHVAPPGHEMATGSPPSAQQPTPAPELHPVADMDIRHPSNLGPAQQHRLPDPHEGAAGAVTWAVQELLQQDPCALLLVRDLLRQAALRPEHVPPVPHALWPGAYTALLGQHPQAAMAAAQALASSPTAPGTAFSTLLSGLHTSHTVGGAAGPAATSGCTPTACGAVALQTALQVMQIRIHIVAYQPSTLCGHTHTTPTSADGLHLRPAATEAGPPPAWFPAVMLEFPCMPHQAPQLNAMPTGALSAGPSFNSLPVPVPFLRCTHSNAIPGLDTDASTSSLALTLDGVAPLLAGAGGQLGLGAGLAPTHGMGSPMGRPAMAESVLGADQMTQAQGVATLSSLTRGRGLFSATDGTKQTGAHGSGDNAGHADRGAPAAGGAAGAAAAAGGAIPGLDHAAAQLPGGDLLYVIQTWQRHHLLLASVPYAISLFDCRGRVLLQNQGSVDFMGECCREPATAADVMQQPQGAQPLFDASSNAGNAARGAGTPAAQEAWGPAAAQPAAAATANGGCSGAADSSGGGGFSRTFAGMPDVSDVDVLSVLFCLCPDLLDEMLEEVICGNMWRGIIQVPRMMRPCIRAAQRTAANAAGSSCPPTLAATSRAAPAPASAPAAGTHTAAVEPSPDAHCSFAPAAPVRGGETPVLAGALAVPQAAACPGETGGLSLGSGSGISIAGALAGAPAAMESPRKSRLSGRGPVASLADRPVRSVSSFLTSDSGTAAATAAATARAAVMAHRAVTEPEEGPDTPAGRTASFGAPFQNRPPLRSHGPSLVRPTPMRQYSLRGLLGPPPKRQSPSAAGTSSVSSHNVPFVSTLPPPPPSVTEDGYASPLTGSRSQKGLHKPVSSPGYTPLFMRSHTDAAGAASLRQSTDGLPAAAPGPADSPAPASHAAATTAAGPSAGATAAGAGAWPGNSAPPQPEPQLAVEAPGGGLLQPKKATSVPGVFDAPLPCAALDPVQRGPGLRLGLSHLHEAEQRLASSSPGSPTPASPSRTPTTPGRRNRVPPHQQHSAVMAFVGRLRSTARSNSGEVPYSPGRSEGPASFSGRTRPRSSQPRALHGVRRQRSGLSHASGARIDSAVFPTSAADGGLSTPRAEQGSDPEALTPNGGSSGALVSLVGPEVLGAVGAAVEGEAAGAERCGVAWEVEAHRQEPRKQGEQAGRVGLKGDMPWEEEEEEDGEEAGHGVGHSTSVDSLRLPSLLGGALSRAAGPDLPDGAEGTAEAAAAAAAAAAAGTGPASGHGSGPVAHSPSDTAQRLVSSTASSQRHLLDSDPALPYQPSAPGAMHTVFSVPTKRLDQSDISLTISTAPHLDTTHGLTSTATDAAYPTTAGTDIMMSRGADGGMLPTAVPVASASGQTGLRSRGSVRRQMGGLKRPVVSRDSTRDLLATAMSTSTLAVLGRVHSVRERRRGATALGVGEDGAAASSEVVSREVQRPRKRSTDSGIMGPRARSRDVQAPSNLAVPRIFSFMRSASRKAMLKQQQQQQQQQGGVQADSLSNSRRLNGGSPLPATGVLGYSVLATGVEANGEAAGGTALAEMHQSMHAQLEAAAAAAAASRASRRNLYASGEAHPLSVDRGSSCHSVGTSRDRASSGSTGRGAGRGARDSTVYARLSTILSCTAGVAGLAEQEDAAAGCDGSADRDASDTDSVLLLPAQASGLSSSARERTGPGAAAPAANSHAACGGDGYCDGDSSVGNSHRTIDGASMSVCFSTTVRDTAGSGLLHGGAPSDAYQQLLLAGLRRGGGSGADSGSVGGWDRAGRSGLVSPRLMTPAEMAARGGTAWHEVAATSFNDPVTGARVVALVQNDVSEKVDTEMQLTELMEVEHRLLEQIFPRHVLEHIAMQNMAAAGKGGGGSGGGGRQRRKSQFDLLQGQDCSQLAHHHDQISVLFCDVKGFTAMCSSVEPAVVMSFLNMLYTTFDELLAAHDVYKVETIGDCYMVAGGLVRRGSDGVSSLLEPGEVDPDHARKVVRFAKAVLEVVHDMQMPDGQPLQVRVGIHSGPATSGVVGTKMPRFCLFGDTINTASRMESTCPACAIHVTPEVQQLVPEEQWVPTGGVMAKGKGVLRTFLLTSPNSAPHGGAPPDPHAAHSSVNGPGHAPAASSTGPPLATAAGEAHPGADGGAGGAAGSSPQHQHHHLRANTHATPHGQAGAAHGHPGAASGALDVARLASRSGGLTPGYAAHQGGPRSGLDSNGPAGHLRDLTTNSVGLLHTDNTVALATAGASNALPDDLYHESLDRSDGGSGVLVGASGGSSRTGASGSAGLFAMGSRCASSKLHH